jgi:hypothetical protein
MPSTLRGNELDDLGMFRRAAAVCLDPERAVATVTLRAHVGKHITQRQRSSSLGAVKAGVGL